MSAGTQRRGLNLRDLALRVLERHRVRPDLGSWTDVPEPRESALLAGETGILLVAFRLTSGSDLAETLHTRVRENVDNEADEIMWGAPGTLVAARLMLDWTQDPRWREAWDESADAVLARRDSDGQWTQRLHGHAIALSRPRARSRRKRPGARAAARFNASVGARAPYVRASSNVPRSSRTVSRTGRPKSKSAWRTRAERSVLQWCHGAPGIICSTASYLDESLLLASAELTWTAGAHRDAKGASICHGTAGNGYALLKAFARTGDELWLERARRFAVHALAQMRRQRLERGRGRYSLFTGDLGVALYLADCLDARAAYPVLDA